MVPCEVPFTITVTPGSGAPSWSVTLPRSVPWAKAGTDSTSAAATANNNLGKPFIVYFLSAISCKIVLI